MQEALDTELKIYDNLEKYWYKKNAQESEKEIILIKLSFHFTGIIKQGYKKIYIF